jgi:nitrate reductase gamma subunit
MSYINELAFGIYPYLALATFLIGTIVRFDRDQYSWRSGSSQLLRARQLRWGSNLFHIGILLLFAGHFVGLLSPRAVYHAFGLTAATKQLLSMVAGGIFGAICFVGMTLLVHRRLFDARVRATSSFMDISILLLIYVQLILGMASIWVSREHMDGGNMVLMAEWAQHIVTFRWGAADFLGPVHWIYKLHIFLGLTMFLVFPFTRLVHVWSVPIWYVFRRYQIVRRRV